MTIAERAGDHGEWFWNYHHPARRWKFDRLVNRETNERQIIRVNATGDATANWRHLATCDGKLQEREVDIGCPPTFCQPITELANAVGFGAAYDLSIAVVEAYHAYLELRDEPEPAMTAAGRSPPGFIGCPWCSFETNAGDSGDQILENHLRRCRPRLVSHPKHQKIRARDAVDLPSHYDTAIEAIDAIDAWDLSFCLGTTLKYLARAGRKDPTKTIEDLKKAAWYLAHEIERLEDDQRAAAELAGITTGTGPLVPAVPPALHGADGSDANGNVITTTNATTTKS